MSIDRHYWEGKDIPENRDVEYLAAAIRQKLSEYGFEQYHTDSFNKYVIDKYVHQGYEQSKLIPQRVPNTVQTPEYLRIPGNIELLYRSDGGIIHSNETAYHKSDIIVEEVKTERDFVLRVTNNLTDENSGLVAKLTWDLINIRKKR
jgi:hypothetical protein